jgi:type I restriction enzyme S subunit
MSKVTIGEIAILVSKGTTPTSVGLSFSNKGVPFIRGEDVVGSSVDFNQVKMFINDHSHAILKRSALMPGDVLVTIAGTIGRTGYIDKQSKSANCNQAVAFIRLPLNRVDPIWLCALLSSPKYQAKFGKFVAGGAIPNVNLEQIKSLEIALIDIGEQRQIAAKLKTQLAEVETARKALDIQERDVKKLETQLLESIFVKLKPEKFVKIGDVAVTTSGSTPSRDKKDYWAPGQYAWIKTGEVAYEPIYDTEESISEKALTECSLTLLPPKTVLVAMYGQGKTRGQSAVLEVPATTNQACFAILPNKTFHPEYLQYWLRHSYSNLRSLSDGRGGNQANLNGAMLKEFTVPLLPMEKQVRLAMTVKNMLDEIDNVKTTIQANKKEIELLSTRLLAQAFESLSAQ